MTRRRSVAAAITLVCTLTVLAAPGLAYADPQPPPAAATAQAGDRTAAAPEKSLEEVSKEVDALYRKAGAATDAYNLAKEQADKQSSLMVELAQDMVRGQTKIDLLKQQVGVEARAQYRDAGLPPEVRLMLSGDPSKFLEGATRLRAGQHAQHTLLSQLTTAQQDLKEYTRDANSQWQKLEANRARQAKSKKDIEKKLAAAKKLESGLQKKELAQLAELERQQAQKAQTAWLNSGILREIDNKAGPLGKKAVAFATKQIGKPYVWGAEGPKSYDCSGLTSQAWAAAGHPIPRTSQEQWKQLPHVAVRDMRPGDLIIYFSDATHVGMYIGGGMMVNAPRPGRDVTIGGAGSMPILGVVRPDA
ncbi:C40 family peptidase [Streptomyces sp. NBC_00344]|uniref:C40 family peptidase n=1 Tax=Streptomyces sp. NBC_00344 TaxID=2975720 RepID=UPI002E1ECAB1